MTNIERLNRSSENRGVGNVANYVYGTKTVCPFYLKEAQKSITCEGLIDGTCNMTRFNSEDEKTQYQSANCEMYNYTNCCKLAAALEKKYEEAHREK